MAGFIDGPLERRNGKDLSAHRLTRLLVHPWISSSQRPTARKTKKNRALKREIQD